MPVRTIEYEVHADAIYPNGMQFGGMQYEDNATEIKYVLSEKLKEVLGETAVFRIDFSSASAGYHPSENLTPVNNTVSRTIPLEMTAFGGQMQTVFTALTVENGVETTVLSYPTTVYFTPVQKSDVNSDRLKENLSRFEIAMDGYLSDAKEICETAEQLATEASERVLQIPDAEKRLQNKAEKQEAANALRGDKTAQKSVELDDVSPVTHTLDIKVLSKNLVDIDNGDIVQSRLSDALECTRTETGIKITAKTDISNSWNNVGCVVGKTADMKGKTYTLSHDAVGFTSTISNAVPRMSVLMFKEHEQYPYYIGNSNYIQPLSNSTQANPLTFTVPTDADDTKYPFVAVCFFMAGGQDLVSGDTTEYSGIMLESGNQKTDYVKWLEVGGSTVTVADKTGSVVTEHTVNADGTVDGALSRYPYTVVSSDIDDVMVDVGYNRDINKAFSELLSKVGG